MALHRHPRSLRLRRRFAERIRVDEKRGGDLGQGRALDRGDAVVICHIGRHSKHARALVHGPTGNRRDPSQVLRAASPGAGSTDRLV